MRNQRAAATPGSDEAAVPLAVLPFSLLLLLPGGGGSGGWAAAAP